MRRLLLLFALLFLAGCTHTRHFVPDTDNRYRLPTWPAGSVSLQVLDARREKADDSAGLVAMVTTIASDALTTDSGTRTAAAVAGGDPGSRSFASRPDIECSDTPPRNAHGERPHSSRVGRQR